MSWYHILNLLKGRCMQFQALYVRGYRNSSVKKVRINKQPGRFLKQNRESTEGCSNNIVWKITKNSGKKIGVNKYICKSQLRRDQVSGEVNVPCQHATPVANVYVNISLVSKRLSLVKRSRIGIQSDRWRNVIVFGPTKECHLIFVREELHIVW